MTFGTELRIFEQPLEPAVVPREVLCLDASGRAETFATAATISGVAGVVLLASGIVLLVTAR